MNYQTMVAELTMVVSEKIVLFHDVVMGVVVIVGLL